MGISWDYYGMGYNIYHYEKKRDSQFELDCPFGKQTWLAGQFPMHRFNFPMKISIDLWGIFQPATFGYTLW